MSPEEIIQVFRELGLDEKIDEPYPGAEEYASFLMSRYVNILYADDRTATDSSVQLNEKGGKNAKLESGA